jgi:hypothetical protein
MKGWAASPAQIFPFFNVGWFGVAASILALPV